MVLIARALALALGAGTLAILAAAADGKKTESPPAVAQTPKADAPPRPGERRLAMTPPVACESVAGYEQYVPLPEATLSKDDKLLVYYRPVRYAIVPAGSKFQAHFVQDVRVRKRGDKSVIWSKEKLFEQKFESPEPPTAIYMYNKIALKGLSPGEYDLDIILHDMNTKGPPAEQVLHFKVKPSASTPAPESKDGGKAPEKTAGDV
jgi:hypothetical protein